MILRMPTGLTLISIDTIRSLFLQFFNNEEGYDARERVEQIFNDVNDHNQRV